MNEFVLFGNTMNFAANGLFIWFLFGYVFWFFAFMFSVLFPIAMVALFIYSLVNPKGKQKVTKEKRDYE